MKNYNDKKTHISDYSEVYDMSRDYKKFDFVYNTGDGLYYYAKNDVSASFFDVTYRNSDRFTLDPSGPIFEQRNSFYIFDSYNESLELFPGQNINVSGSIAQNDGDYKIIDIDRNYGANSVKQYTVDYILDAEEVNDANWFTSSWFLFMSKSFSWEGRDFKKYVEKNAYLLEEFNSSSTNETIEEFGKRKYKTEGRDRGDIMPLNKNGRMIFNNKLGFIYLDIFGADISENSLWFNITSIEKVWFWSKPDLQSENSAVVYFKQAYPEVFIGFGAFNNSLPISLTPLNIVSSENGNSCFFYRDHSEIKPFIIENDHWVEDVNSLTITLNQNNFVYVKKFSYDLETVVLLESSSELFLDSLGELKIYSTVNGNEIQSLGQFSKNSQVEFDRLGYTMVISDTTGSLNNAGSVKIYEFSDNLWKLVKHIENLRKGWCAGISLSGDGKSLSIRTDVSSSYMQGIFTFHNQGGVWGKNIQYSDLSAPKPNDGEEWDGVGNYRLRCAFDVIDQIWEKNGSSAEIDNSAVNQFCYDAYVENYIYGELEPPDIKILNDSGYETNAEYIKISETGRFLFTYVKYSQSTKVHVMENNEWVILQTLPVETNKIEISYDEQTLLIVDERNQKSIIYVFDGEIWKISHDQITEEIRFAYRTALISSSKNLDRFSAIINRDNEKLLTSFKTSKSAEYEFDISEGWMYWRESSNKKYIEVYNFTNKNWWLMKYTSGGVELSKFRSEEEVDISKIPETFPQFSISNGGDQNLSTRIWVQPLSENGDSFQNYEDASSHEISISSRSSSPSANQDDWTTDQFFFDADYGSTVNFKAENKKMEFGNGYYKISPMSINSLKCEIDLQFKNRTNREANAIIHFLENHLGQLEKDKNNNFLKYSQGISGFRWDGDSTFHPYDNVDNQTKTFYCTNFNHSLNFEDSNDVSLTLKNLNTSILNRAETLYVNSAPTYDEQEVYEKNDVVFSDINNEYYYWQNNEGYSNLEPVRKNDSWSRENGYFSDQNTQYWTKEFFWKPSIGLNISQEPRVKEISLSSKYTQIYNDGINESLLNLDLSFNNRTDEEAYAILHFLESHLGYRPFLFSPPAPYETPQNFICQGWSHTYNYKNNHSIKAKFEQFPLNLSAQQFNASATAPLIGAGQLIFRSPLVFVSKTNDQDSFDQNKKLRKRLLIENVGGEDVLISSMHISDASPSFYIIASDAVPLVVDKNLNQNDYKFQLPSLSLPFSLSLKTVLLKKSASDGIDGGVFFDEINISDQSVVASYFQRNDGSIKKIGQNNFITCDYYILQSFFEKNRTNLLPAGSKGFIDIVYKKSGASLEELLVNENNENIQYIENAQSGSIIIKKENFFLENELIVESSAPFSPQKGKLKIYLKDE